MTDIQELRVLIVGFGSIGYRHFQGLGLSQHSVSVDVIDPIQERNLLLEKEPLDSGYNKIRFFESILIIGDNNEELHNDCFLIFVVNYFFIARICKDFAMGFPGGCTGLGSSCIERNIHIGASWKYL